ncbi:MAG: hypothetical protein ACYCS7_01220 [Acidimicrobiales bacterium]
MSLRFILNTLTAVAAAGVVVVSMALGTSETSWVAFAVSTAVAVAAVGGLIAARTIGDQIGQASVAALGLWSLIAALVFTGPLLTWFVFGNAIAVGAMALAQLVGHEITTRQALRAAVGSTGQAPGQVKMAA